MRNRQGFAAAGGPQSFRVHRPRIHPTRGLDFVLSNSVWKNNELTATFQQPFGLIAETAMIAAKRSASEGQ
jgi:site-specific DNA recombinase